MIVAAGVFGVCTGVRAQASRVGGRACVWSPVCLWTRVHWDGEAEQGACRKRASCLSPAGCPVGDAQWDKEGICGVEGSEWVLAAAVTEGSLAHMADCGGAFS